MGRHNCQAIWANMKKKGESKNKTEIFVCNVENIWRPDQ